MIDDFKNNKIKYEIELISSYDKNLVKYVKQEVTKKLTYLNQMFLFIKSDNQLKQNC